MLLIIITVLGIKEKARRQCAYRGAHSPISVWGKTDRMSLFIMEDRLD